jgi:hypothetical protein
VELFSYGHFPLSKHFGQLHTSFLVHWLFGLRGNGQKRRQNMHNLVAVGIFLALLFAGIGVLMAGLGIYEWGKGKSKKN